mmetsp:Transcript_6917/g.20219  ORF Transcript_6917/g.20219 Transcript_6917/m.20219 type:complete len:223 (-) Transcript_6917:61-729(-)
MMGALGLMSLMRFSTFLSSSSSSTKSTLFSRTMSANASCSWASFSTPSGFSSSSLRMRCLASTTVTMASSSYSFSISGSIRKVCATGAGSAKPVVSMITPSNLAILVWSLLRASTRSPLTVQQMHPFITSITSSSMFSLSLSSPPRIFSSIPTSPNSFSMMANLNPWFSESKWFSKVVFPDPRNPVSTVTGTLPSGRSLYFLIAASSVVEYAAMLLLLFPNE